MSGNFNYVEVLVTGPEQTVIACEESLFGGGIVDFNSAVRMPDGLNFEYTNVVETGYEAIYGDWSKVAKMWMFKEAAVALNLPFPFESREDLLNAFRSMDCWQDYLKLADQVKSNLERFGFASREPWQLKYWGAGENANGGKVKRTDAGLRVAFVVDKLPEPVLKSWSKQWPQLDFAVTHADEHKRGGKSMTIVAGRITRKEVLSIEERKKVIDEFGRF